jgi:hypothetical protein
MAFTHSVGTNYCDNAGTVIKYHRDPDRPDRRHQHRCGHPNRANPGIRRCYQCRESPKPDDLLGSTGVVQTNDQNTRRTRSICGQTSRSCGRTIAFGRASFEPTCLSCT